MQAHNLSVTDVTYITQETAQDAPTVDRLVILLEIAEIGMGTKDKDQHVTSVEAWITFEEHAQS